MGILTSLMELYLSNNKIENLKEVILLMNQPKLIILDVSANLFCKDPSYRIYTLYHLKRLKVLDGISIDSNEQMMAKDIFTGRLTEEILL